MSRRYKFHNPEGKEKNLEIVLARFKEFTSKKLVREIESNLEESGREWLLEIDFID